MRDTLYLLPKNALADSLEEAELRVFASNSGTPNFKSMDTPNFSDFLNSPQAIGSLSDPGCLIKVMLPTSRIDRHSQTLTDCFLGANSEKTGWVTGPRRAWQLELDSMLAPFSKRASYFALDDNDSQTPLELCQTHLIQTLAKTNPRELEKGGFKTALAWSLSTSPTRKNVRLVAVAGMLSLIIGLWNWGAYVQSQTTQQNLTQLRKNISQRTKTDFRHDWAQWQTMVAKFGKGVRANLTEVRFSWQQNVGIDTQTLINRPRKTLPKGCSQGPTELILCQTVPARSSSSGTSQGRRQ